MKKIMGTAAMLVAALAIAGCSAGMSTDTNGAQGSVTTAPGTGGVVFNLDLPNGESISTINLHLSCAGIEQDHVLDVVNGEVVAAFGGLAPGQCTATMTSQTPSGTDCLGSEVFTVVVDVTTPVTVTLMCQAINEVDGGRAEVRAEFEVKVCTTDRIKKLYAIPSNVLTGSSTTVEVETWPGTVVGTPSFTFEAVNEGTYTATGALSASAACSPLSASCQDFECQDLGTLTPAVDPISGLPHAGVWIDVTVEDDDCYDTERVWVDCQNAAVCNNGSVEGTEECDGTVGVGAGEACDATCHLLYCGDGLVNVSGETCDGTTPAMTLLHQHCDSACHTVQDAFCGDNVVNQVSEQCDGSSTVLPVHCDSACHVVVECGNGITEAGEACDNGASNGLYPATCSTSCTTNVAPNVCKNCMQTDSAAAMTAYLVPCLANGLCTAMVDCLSADTTNCWLDPAIGPASCYCGVDTDSADCEAPGFNPATPSVGVVLGAPGYHGNIGVCQAQILAAASFYPSHTNADVLANMFDAINFPVIGNAGKSMNRAFSTSGPCRATCIAH